MGKACRVERYLTAYADNELSDRVRARIERHLSCCEACARELDSIVASDRIVGADTPPSVSDARWRTFRSQLSASLDRVDRGTARARRPREALPVYGSQRRRAISFATAAVAVALVLIVFGPVGTIRRWAGWGNGSECFVDSIESYASGYTPMFFTSKDPEMTVIWVFSDEVAQGPSGERMGAP
jgi:anti-sigma factor RsiW